MKITYTTGEKNTILKYTFTFDNGKVDTDTAYYPESFSEDECRQQLVAHYQKLNSVNQPDTKVQKSNDWYGNSWSKNDYVPTSEETIKLNS